MAEEFEGPDTELMIRQAFMAAAQLSTTFLLCCLYWVFGNKLGAMFIGSFGVMLMVVTYFLSQDDSKAENPWEGLEENPDRSPHYIPELDPTSPKRARAKGQKTYWLAFGGGGLLSVLAVFALAAGVGPIWHMLFAASLITFSPLTVLWFT